MGEKGESESHSFDNIYLHAWSNPVAYGLSNAMAEGIVNRHSKNLDEMLLAPFWGPKKDRTHPLFEEAQVAVEALCRLTDYGRDLIVPDELDRITREQSDSRHIYVDPAVPLVADAQERINALAPKIARYLEKRTNLNGTSLTRAREYARDGLAIVKLCLAYGHLMRNARLDLFGAVASLYCRDKNAHLYRSFAEEQRLNTAKQI